MSELEFTLSGVARIRLTTLTASGESTVKGLNIKVAIVVGEPPAKLVSTKRPLLSPSIKAFCMNVVEYLEFTLSKTS